jgi:glycine reductase
MTRELERAGLPVAQVCTVINVALESGANRVVPSQSVLYPTGDPSLSSDAELALRQELVRQSLAAIRTQVSEPTVIE